MAVCLMTAAPCFAQWDIKIFDGIGKDAIIQILGVPDSDQRRTDWTDDCIVIDYRYSAEYPGTSMILEEETLELIGFNTESPAFCILSDYIPGGVKVGDGLAKLQSFDFVHTAYGKDNPGNALKLIDSSSERDYYEIYGKERVSFRFCIKNGIIIGMDMDALDQDAAIHLNCDMTSSPW